MTAPTLTRLGVLRTHAHGHYDAGEQNAGMTLHTVVGLEIRRDDGSPSPALHPGFVYRIAPNDGWAVDPTTPPVHHKTPHWGHLVTVNGQVAQHLPLTDGTVALDRAHSYVIREEGQAGWVVYQS